MVIKSECRVRDNTEICYLIRYIGLGVSNFNRWYGRTSATAKALISGKKYGFRLVRVRQRPLKQNHDRNADILLLLLSFVYFAIRQNADAYIALNKIQTEIKKFNLNFNQL